MLAAFPLLFFGAFDFAEVSGVKVSCLENLRGKTGRARVELVVGSGALNESDDQRGVAHLLEHLLMRPLNFDDKNAETSLDYTTYFWDAKAAELSTAAVDLVHAVARLELADGAFEVEREVVLREMELRGSRELAGVDPLFGGTILARDAGGTEESVRGLEKEDALAFHAKHYVRGNIAVVLRGAMSCADAVAELAPSLAMFPEGAAIARPRVAEKEPGARALPVGFHSGAFVQGFYWFDATTSEEMLMRVVAKHLEQEALEDLRKKRGMTYSPFAEVLRVGGGGLMRLRVITDGQNVVVAGWYEQQLRELREAKTPRAVLERALGVVGDHVELESVGSGLAAIRGEVLPEKALAGMDDAAMRAMIAKMLAEERAFGSTTPSKNVASIAILIVFALTVLGALAFAGRRFLRV